MRRGRGLAGILALGALIAAQAAGPGCASDGPGAGGDADVPTLADEGPQARDLVVTRVCTPGDTRCSRDFGEVETCDADGAAWESRSCGDGQACEDAACVPRVCTPRESRCREGEAVVEKCRASGAGWDSVTCLSGDVCIGGGCVPVLCTAGQRRCTGDHKATETCTPNGGGWIQDACPSDQRCRDGECRPAICPPARWTCTDGGTARALCDDSGTLLGTPEPCPGERSCWDGECATSAQGEVVVVPAEGRQALSPGKYAAVVVNTETTEGIVAWPLTLTGSIVLSPAPSTDGAEPLPTPAWTPGTVHRRMPPRVDAARPLPAPAAFPAPRYDVGDGREFWLPSETGWGTLSRNAVLRYQGERANYWEDVTDHEAAIGEADLKDIATRLDGGVFARDEALFGKPTDVDGNGRVDVLFTSTLSAGSTYAFVWPVTLYPPGSFGIQTDHGEVVYCRPPGSSNAEIAGVIAHEMAHLLVAGQRLDQPDNGDAYLNEGLAELARAWSGQAQATHAIFALDYPLSWSLAALMRAEYYEDLVTNLTHYGFGALVAAYLFEQAGAVTVTGPGTLEDRGGVAYLFDVVHRAQGFPRLDLPDGRTHAQWYVDLATALLLGTLPHDPGPLARAEPRYRFSNEVPDAWFGGFIGMPLKFVGASRLKRGSWAAHGDTLKRGGVSFVTVTVSEPGALATMAPGQSTAVLVRYKP